MFIFIYCIVCLVHANCTQLPLFKHVLVKKKKTKKHIHVALSDHVISRQFVLLVCASIRGVTNYENKCL